MSYCRFFTADAYIYEHVGGFWICDACRIADNHPRVPYFSTTDPRQMVEHIEQHREEGHHIPDHVLEAFREHAREGYEPSRRDEVEHPAAGYLEAPDHDQ